VPELKQYAEERQIPIIHFEHGERKDERANRLRRQRPGRFGFSRDKTVYVNH